MPHEMIMDSMMPCFHPQSVSMPMTVSMVSKIDKVAYSATSTLRVKSTRTAHARAKAIHADWAEDEAIAVWRL